MARADVPYRGLEPYQEEDARLFCGREAATTEVLERLGKMDEERNATGGVLVVVGPSGSGKSSLLRAGVVPAVRAGGLDAAGRHWGAAVMTPGLAPLETLDQCLSGPSDIPVLVVVDQFEEVFRLAPETRTRFLDRLGSLGPSRGLVVAVLRADFYEAATMEPVLLAGLRHNQVLVGPMTQEEVRDAIVRPAQEQGVSVDDGLVELLLADLAPRSPTGLAHEAGALPLLSHALLATWERAHRNQLTVADYRAAGGLRGAIRQSAEELYLDLGTTEQDLARRIFCRLVNVEEDVPFTRRRVSQRELEQLGEGATTVLDRFVAARLVTADATGAQVSHEALLSAWPRLADWLDADRAGLRIHHQLTDGANAWLAAGKDPSLLQRGTRLALTSEWASEAGRSDDLNVYERDFLDASQVLQAAEARDARRRTRRTQQLLGLVAALAVVASVLAGFALEARSSAKQAGNEALSRQVAIEASQLEPTDPALAMQLALAAYRISPTVQARAMLLDASASEMPTRILGPSGHFPSHRGRRPSARGRPVRHRPRRPLLPVKAPRPVALATLRVASPAAQTFTVALSPDGRLLAASGTDGTITLFDVSDPSRPTHLATLRGFTSTVYDVTFGPGGRTLAAASNDGSVRQWDLSQPARPSLAGVVRAPGNQPLQAVGYSTDGRLLAAAGAGGTLLIWRSGEDRARTISGAGTAQLTSLAFSPDGRTLVTGGEDDVVRVFSVAPSGDARPARSPSRFFELGELGRVRPRRSQPRRRELDDSLREWATSDWATRRRARAHLPRYGSGVPARGQHPRHGRRRWNGAPVVDAATEHLPHAGGCLRSRLHSKRGNVGGGERRGGRRRIPVGRRRPRRPVHVGEVTMPASFGPVAGVGALSPSGQLLAVGNAAARIQLVSLANPRRPKLVGPPLLRRRTSARGTRPQPGRHRPGERRQFRARPSVGRERPRAPSCPGYAVGVRLPHRRCLQP